ncbi:predicted protein [Aspergillus nidulans FGSC A4]|uniref:Uncharacterized protein n=1 Tax=Emericella nidulans (strain FGSC A4 / ATCC 38163 / CBS 112.46 / NRRL 194 / M139) TaxID=227321 RepID=Q5B5R4_EMENI|nr:hypothetical protein [Aspergillus nidulans FGSC A4]EAA59377.1 predicted protein [Aspergillus nidulans FGSC A4]CBF74673.1 TPA: conserved hypothetical protein [Aspergillus nidulans FGSC A4]|eukprot:XP_661720.1 predicted protein [Aspergillus nidulans FGSC A4]
MQVSVVSGQDAIAINLPARYEQRLRLDTIYPFQTEFTRAAFSTAAAVYKTEPFTLRDMVSSAENGCRGCRFLAAVLAGVGSVYAYTELELAGMAFKWLGSSFTLDMTMEDGTQSSGGCFSETIPDSCILIPDPGWPAVYLGVRDCQGAGTIVQGPLPALHAIVGVSGTDALTTDSLLHKLEFQVGCQGGLSYECGGDSIAPHFKPVPTVMNVAKLKTLSELKAAEGGGGLVGDDFTMLIYRNWVDIVVSYAKLDITVPSDRFSAISVTAKIVSRNMKSEYLAGIWRATFMEEGLLWAHSAVTVEADGPLNQDWTRCTFAEPALDLMGAKLSFYADAYIDRDKYGFWNALAKGRAGLRHVIYFMFLERDALR